MEKEEWVDVYRPVIDDHRLHDGGTWRSTGVGYVLRSSGEEDNWIYSALIRRDGPKKFALATWCPDGSTWIEHGVYPTVKGAKAAAAILMRVEGLL